MELIEEVVYENKRELEEREQFWINEFHPCTNSKRALRTEEERIEQKIKWYEDNREGEIIRMNDKGKQIINCNCGFTHTYSNKSNHLKSQLHADGLKMCSLD